ncbi:MAG: hypothetical protein GX927_13270, partial [Lentisphaerae bacterium]|nr:hypothetical protein [Lentisphaerota bacterium]
MNLNALDEPQVVDSRLLFDFTTLTAQSLEEWHYVPWGEAVNRAHLTKDAKRGAKIVFPQKDYAHGAYPAPNVVFDFKEPQNWSKYNFLVVKLFNPMDENMPLWIDIYSTDNPDGAAIFNKIPAGEYELRIPLSRYINFRRPLNIKQVNRFCFIQRDIQRDIPFFIHSVRLEAVRAPEQRYDFPGLAAWQFTTDKTRAKRGFQAVTAPDAMWSGAPVTIKDNPYLCRFGKKFDPIWWSSASGIGKSDMTMTAPDG